MSKPKVGIQESASASQFEFYSHINMKIAHNEVKLNIIIQQQSLY